jgi:hypothetical protein
VGWSESGGQLGLKLTRKGLADLGAFSHLNTIARTFQEAPPAMALQEMLDSKSWSEKQRSPCLSSHLSLHYMAHIYYRDRQCHNERWTEHRGKQKDDSLVFQEPLQSLSSPFAAITLRSLCVGVVFALLSISVCFAFAFGSLCTRFAFASRPFCIPFALRFLCVR